MTPVLLLIVLTTQGWYVSGESLSISQDILQKVKDIVQFVEPAPRGLLEDIEAKLNETIVAVAESIKEANITFEDLPLRTGDIEIGGLNINLHEGAVTGLGDFVAEIIDVTIIPIALKNLTLHWKSIGLACANYNVTGYMNFPLDNQIIEMSGSGKMFLKLEDLRISANVKIGYENGAGAVVKDLQLLAFIDDIELYFGNLFNDAELSWAFNTVIEDVGVVVFDYYKEALLDALKPLITDIINAILQAIFP